MYRVPHVGSALVIAHRGGAALAPENSYEAFENCARLGFHLVETDAHLTADGEVVLIHDPVLERISDGFGPVSMHTWDALQKVKLRGSAHGLQRLRDMLDAFPDLRFNIDAKEESVWRPLVDVVMEAGAQDRVLIASFDSKRLDRVREYAPQLQTSLGRREVMELVLGAQLGLTRRPFRSGLNPVQSARHSLRSAVQSSRSGSRWSQSDDRSSRSAYESDQIVAAQVPMSHRGINIVTPRFIATAHHWGLAVHVWTLNEPDQIVAALDAGVDGVITDHPILAQQIIEARAALGDL